MYVCQLRDCHQHIMLSYNFMIIQQDDNYILQHVMKFLYFENNNIMLYFLSITWTLLHRTCYNIPRTKLKTHYKNNIFYWMTGSSRDIADPINIYTYTIDNVGLKVTHTLRKSSKLLKLARNSNVTQV